MKKQITMRLLLSLLVAGIATGSGVASAAQASLQKGGTSGGGKPTKPKGGDPEPPRGSLDADTCGCPTVFDQPTCERRARWDLDVRTTSGPMLDPFLEPFSFDVVVTETSHRDVLSGKTRLVLTNSGDGYALLSSVAVLLESYVHKGGDAPGPGGKAWEVVDSAIAVESPFAEAAGIAPTCYGDVVRTPTGRLVLIDPSSNDVIALSEVLPIPPTLDNDGDGLRDEDPAYDPDNLTGGCDVIDNDGDGLYDEDPIAGIDNDGDGLVDEDPIAGLDDDGDGLVDEDPIAGIDNDGDGLVDEDPVDGVDNDLDGLIDEDSADDDGDGLVNEDDPDDDRDGLVNEDDPDDDGDGLVNEDDPDDDGDGLVDEDGACEDGVVILVDYEFDVTAAGLPAAGDGVVPSADDQRIDVIATFVNAGKRSGSATCTLDANLNGVIDPDDPATPDVNESEEKNVRSVKQRLRFDPVECTPSCETLWLQGRGAFADDPDCVAVTSNTLNEMVVATGVDGTQHMYSVEGQVTCLSQDPCGTLVHSFVSLEATGCEARIVGSPAGASFEVRCRNALPTTIAPGDFCTLTQDRWGNPATEPLLNANFGAIFPDGLVVGDPDGPDADSSWAVLLTVLPGPGRSVIRLLPALEPPGVLSADLTNPFTTSAGQLAGQLVAVKLNLGYEAAGVRPLGGVPVFPPGTLGQLVLESGVAPGLLGLSVHELVDVADAAISGGPTPAGVTVSDIAFALRAVNLEYQSCAAVRGVLGFPF